jgi:hypothetical protein
VNKLYKIIGQILEALLDSRARANRYYWNWFNSYSDMEDARKWARHYKALYEDMETKYWEAQWHIDRLEPKEWAQEYWIEGWDKFTPTEWEIGSHWEPPDDEE